MALSTGLTIGDSNPTRDNTLCDPAIVILRLGFLCIHFMCGYDIHRDIGFIANAYGLIVFNFFVKLNP